MLKNHLFRLFNYFFLLKINEKIRFILKRTNNLKVKISIILNKILAEILKMHEFNLKSRF